MASGCTGKGAVLQCLTLLARLLDASSAPGTCSAFSPKQVHLFSPPQLVSPQFLILLPICRQWFCLVMATCLPKGVSAVGLCNTTAPHAFLGRKNSSSPCFHQPVSETVMALFSCATFLMLSNTLLHQICNLYSMKMGKKFLLFASKVKRWVLKSESVFYFEHALDDLPKWQSNTHFIYSLLWCLMRKV